MISFIVPFYKSKETIIPLYNKLCDLDSLINEEFEFIFIEDNSEDGSWEIIQQIAENDPRLKAIRFSRNFGQHKGITAGLDLCSGDWAVVMDCDFQDAPEEIPRLYRKAREGFDMVCARRRNRKDAFWKRLASYGFNKAFRYLSGMDYDPSIANFRILSRKVIDSFCSMRENLRFFGGHLEWLGFRVGYLDVEHASRLNGKSSYTFPKLMNLAIDTIIAYSNKPLYLSIKAGFLISFVSFCFSVFLIYRKIILGIPVPGWSSIMVSIWLLGGLILANLGIIGIYLGKVFDETKKRPLYVISERINF